MKRYLLTLLLLSVVLSSRAQLTTAKLFSDHMVLQRNQPIPVWGWAKKKAKVTIIFNGEYKNIVADDAGNWKVLLKPMPEGGPYSMTILSEKEHLAYSDIMLGEVWICSGQSNMEFQLKNAFGYQLEQKNVPQLPIRQFHVPDKMSLVPEKDLSGGEWIKADTGTIGDFTAVGYFFAKKLAAQLHVTVGLIYSNWGGTQVEDWISKEAMLGSPELSEATKKLPENWDDLKTRVDGQLKAFAYRNGPVVNYTSDQLAGQPSGFFDNWQVGNSPGPWEWEGKFYSYRGQGFMERNIKLDAAVAAHPSTLHLGQTDADLTIYINGKLITKSPLPAGYQLNLPAGTWKEGDNSLLIDLQSQQKNPSWYGVGLSGSAANLLLHFADTTVNLASPGWRLMPDLSKPYNFNFLPNNTGISLYNAMINPLIPYAIAGVIWYQGESNTDRAYQYRTSFPLMITDWRSRWKRDFPFLFVQLTSFGTSQSSNAGSNWAELREAQNMTLQLPATGMAVITDVGDANNIHPKDKADVGYRLANEAFRVAYQLTGFPENPLYSSTDFKGGSALVTFAHAEKGFMVKDQYGYIKGFEVAGTDHKFYYAQAMITPDNKVKVWCQQVAQPVAVRYAWTNAPLDANLYSKDGLPVSQFRSDNWAGLTVGKKFE